MQSEFFQRYLTAIRILFYEVLIRTDSYDLTRTIVIYTQWRVGLGAGIGVGH